MLYLILKIFGMSYVEWDRGKNSGFLQCWIPVLFGMKQQICIGSQWTYLTTWCAKY